jgi:hypothetical protein
VRKRFVKSQLPAKLALAGLATALGLAAVDTAQSATGERR